MTEPPDVYKMPYLPPPAPLLWCRALAFLPPCSDAMTQSKNQNKAVCDDGHTRWYFSIPSSSRSCQTPHSGRDGQSCTRIQAVNKCQNGFFHLAAWSDTAAVHRQFKPCVKHPLCLLKPWLKQQRFAHSTQLLFKKNLPAGLGPGAQFCSSSLWAQCSI